MYDAALADTAVRNYLLFLDDPTQLVDQAEVDRFERQVQEAKDPLEKLRAMAELARLRSLDGAQWEQGFIKAAREWAAANGVPASTFAEYGVSAATLQSAGLASVEVAGGKRAPSATKAAGVTAELLRTRILESKMSPFTTSDVAGAFGGSPMTVRKAIADLLADGSVESLGATPDWHGRGRAPIQYVIRTKKK